MPKVDIDAIQWAGDCGYPGELARIADGRFRKALGDAVGLDQFGVNLAKIEPGSGSALRHWHENEDEFVFVLSGNPTLIEDEGETVLKPGDAAGFKAGVPNGHHLVNRTSEDVILLEIGTRAKSERGHYPDDDLAAIIDGNEFTFTHKNGDPY